MLLIEKLMEYTQYNGQEFRD